jgi:hypothetical protein
MSLVSSVGKRVEKVSPTDSLMDNVPASFGQSGRLAELSSETELATMQAGIDTADQLRLRHAPTQRVLLRDINAGGDRHTDSA